MAYLDLARVASIIKNLLHDSNISPYPAFQEIIEFAHNQVKSVDYIAERWNWYGTESLKMKIDEELNRILFKLEGAIESEPSIMKMDGLKQDFRNFVALVKKMETEYADALYNPQDEEEDDGIDVSASIGLKLNMVGLSDQFYQLKEILLSYNPYRCSGLVGMPGIGKTTLASKVFVDHDIVKNFDVRIWVTVGGKCPLGQIKRRILARVDPESLNKTVVAEDVDQLLQESLKGKRHLIVLDDVWVKNLGMHLHTFNETRESCLLVISRLQQFYKSITMRLLNTEESWDLFREKVFGEDSCPTQLERAGKKIAENCDGLPLTIVTLAKHLSEVKEVEYWDEVAAKKNHKIFKDVYVQISKVIRPSYNYLPHLLQLCFLYMGVFRQNHEIPKSKIVTLWNVDGFLEQNQKYNAHHCLNELVSNSLVMIYKYSRIQNGKDIQRCSLHSSLWYFSKIKSCGLQSSLWYFSTTEARKSKFCHVLSSLDDGLDRDMIGQQRLSFHNNILCTIKDVLEYVENNCASTVRSLFYYGPYHPYQVPICFGLSLLRELDILTIRFYEFPVEVLRLAELRYLTLTWDGKLPASISQLSNLRILIVGRHFVVINPSRDRYLPVEIWDMQELQHLQAMGSDLPHPRGCSLKNLTTLSNISAYSCTEENFKAIPNLKKLGIRIELGPNDDGDGIFLGCLDHISHLKKITSLKFIIVNPNIIFSGGTSTSFRSAIKKFRLSKLGQKERNGGIYHREILRYLKNAVVSPKIVPSLASITILPSSLIHLTLSGLGLPWKEMRKIAELPNLQTLKLQNYAFIGPYWRVKNSRFPSLTSLWIEDSDLVQWHFGSGCFKLIECITLKYCYKYERMVGESTFFPHKIDFFACNPLGIRQMQETMWYADIEWGIYSSIH